MAIPAVAAATPGEYLRFEREAEARHELLDGEIVAMSGASRRHDTVVGNLFASLHAQLRAAGRRCRPFTSDMRVRSADSGLYTYPDLSVACGEPEFEDEEVDTLLNPTLLVEVLSPSTAAYVRGEKWERYRSITALREYVLIDADRIHVERYERRDDGTWLFSETADLGATLELPAIGCEVSLSELYDAVDLDLA